MKFERTFKAIVVLLLAAGAVSCSTAPEVAKREAVRKGDSYVTQAKHSEAVIEYEARQALDGFRG